MLFKQPENRLLQQSILGVVALLGAGLLYVATIKQVNDSQIPVEKTTVKKKQTHTSSSSTSTTSKSSSTSQSSTTSKSDTETAPSQSQEVTSTATTPTVETPYVPVEVPTEGVVETPVAPTPAEVPVAEEVNPNANASTEGE